jgi:hypothetical protein
VHPGVLKRLQGELAELGIGHATIQLETRDGCEPVEIGGHARAADGHDHVAPGHQH